MILVSGVTGLVGTSFSAILNENDVDYVACARNCERIKNCVSWDISKTIFPQPLHNYSIDAIVHLAASLTGNDAFLSNKSITENILTFAAQFNVKKIIYVSSINVKYSINTPYTQSKIIGENLVKQSGIPYCIVRPTLIYGGKRNCTITKLRNFMNHAHIYAIPGKGSFKLQPVWSMDVAKLLMQILCKWERSENKTFEIGGAEPLSYYEMCKALKSAYKIKAYPIPIPMTALNILSNFPAFSNIKSFTTEKTANNNEILTVFGLQPVTFSQGLKHIDLP